MIDVHCLVHKINSWFPLLKAQMQQEKDVIFHVVENGPNIGLGRVNGFLKGNAPFVSFVDYDDLIVPGIFAKLNNLLETGYAWVYTDELLIDENGNNPQAGWSSKPELYSPLLLQFMSFVPGKTAHHLLAFRREFLTLPLLFIMKQLNELAECYLMKELGRNANVYHLEEVGYYWRQHPDNGYKQFEAFQLLGGLE